MSGVLRVTVPITLQRNSEGFWLEFKGGGKEALVNLNSVSQGEIILAAVEAWAQESLTQALMSKRRQVGLNDQLGRAVHEGDIVQKATDDPEKPLKGVVKWEAASAAFIIQGNTFRTHNLGGIGQWSIIGNIFQTPELL